MPVEGPCGSSKIMQLLSAPQLWFEPNNLWHNALDEDEDGGDGECEAAG
jgi:hypothetical protein